MVLVEACVETLDAAIAATRGGARRIELCANLAEQGTTPDDALLAACLARIAVPVFPIIRPRAGPFVYDSAEIETMLQQAHRARRLGAPGLVFGALRPDRRVDRDAVTALQQAAGPLSVTFHRAFDVVPDQMEALDDLAALGVARLLTSGGAPTALEGMEAIARLVEHAAGRIVIMAGGGVRAHNVREIVARTSVREVHARLSSTEDVRLLVGQLRSQAQTHGP